MTIHYVTTTGAGSNSGADEANAMTMAQATAAVVAGDKVWVKAGTYSVQDGVSGAVMNITTAGAVGNGIVWEAYTTTIGDFNLGDIQPVIIDALTNTLTNAITFITIAGVCYHTLKGFRFTGASGNGIEGSTTCDRLTLEGCKIDANGGRGIQWDDYLQLVACEFTGNTSNAVDADNSVSMMGCKIHGEQVFGATGVCSVQGFPTFAYNLFYNNGDGAAIHQTAGGGIYIGNTFDGDGQASTIGIQTSGSASVIDILYNNIFFDLNMGLNFATAGVEDVGSRGYNLFYLVTTPYDVLSLHATDITGTADPFTDSTNRDYSLVAGSEALNVGLDGSLI